MTSTRDRSRSNQSDYNQRQAINNSPAPYAQQTSSIVPDDLVLQDVPSYGSTSSHLISNSAGDSPYPAIASGGHIPPPTPTAQRSRAATTADFGAGQFGSYRQPAQRASGGTPLQTGYQSGQRHVSAAQVMDPRPQYLPGPPPIAPQAQQNPMISLPPPPPRLVQNAFPPPPSMLGNPNGLSASWMQQNWAARQQQGFPPPPPPINMGQTSGPYTAYTPQAAYQNNVPSQTLALPRPPPQDQSSREDQPLTSATYIPFGKSFGPGVGIPPLHSHQEPNYGGHGHPEYPASSNIGGSQIFANGSGPSDTLSLETTGYDEFSANSDTPQTPSNRGQQMLPPPRETHEAKSVPPSSYPRQAQNPPPRQVLAASLSSNDALKQWPLERVLIWLAANAFSNDWQETFRILNIEGSTFLDLGVRGNFAMMHNSIYPSLSLQCEQSGTGWEPTRERAEGKRMRKLIRKIAEANHVEEPRTIHTRRTSTHFLPSATSEGHVENSPNLTSVNTPSTAGPGDDSPGGQMYFRPPALGGHRNASSPKGGFFPQNLGTRSNVGDQAQAIAENPQARAGYSRTVLGGMNDPPSKGHSPNNSGETNLGYKFMGGKHHPSRDGSPQSGSPSTQYATLSSSHGSGTLYAPPPGRFGHHRGNSAESINSLNTNNSQPSGLRGVIGGTLGELPMSARGQDGRRSAQDQYRAVSNDSSGRQTSSETTSLKEQGKGFFEKHFRKNRKKDDSSHNFHDDLNPDSPTSPNFFRQQPPNLPWTKPTLSNSDTSIERVDRPSSTTSGTLEREKAQNRGSIEKKYIMVTPDGWNFRLIDATSVDNGDSLRTLICSVLSIPEAENPQIYLTEVGRSEHEEALTDPMLNLCNRSSADSKGSLKFFVRRNTSPQPRGSIPPPISTGLGLFDLPQKALPSPPVGATVFRRPLNDPKGTTRSRSPPTSANPRYGGGRADIVPPSASTTRSSPYIGMESPTVETLRASLEAADTHQISSILSEADRQASVDAAVQKFYKEIEKKKKAYFSPHFSAKKEKPSHKESPPPSSDTWSIRGDRVIDFDVPRHSPYEDKKLETLIPLRKPPPAPAESNTLTKANSLSKRTGEKIRPIATGLGDFIHRRPHNDSIPEEASERGRRKAIAGPPPIGSGIGSALVGAGMMTKVIIGPTNQITNQTSPPALPEHVPQSSTPRSLQAVEMRHSSSGSPGGSPRSPRFTHGKNNMRYRIPEYDDGPEVVPEALPQASPPRPQDTRRPSLSLQMPKKPSHPSLEKLQREPSPDVSPKTPNLPDRRASTMSRRSYGPAFTFKENPVAFAKPAIIEQDSDEDSDDGLFARPLAKSEAKAKSDKKAAQVLGTAQSQLPGRSDSRNQPRPQVTSDSTARAQKVKSVSFAEPDRPLIPSLDPSISELEGNKRLGIANMERLVSDGGLTVPDSVRSLDNKSDLRRRDSFARDDVWANRPPTEALLENLDAYFPNVDLDQPVFEDQLGSPPTSPATATDQNPMDLIPESLAQRFARSRNYDYPRPMSIAEEPIAEESEYLGSQDSTLKSIASVNAQPRTRQSAGLGRMKSIREVAKGANHSRRRTIKSQTGQAGQAGTNRPGDLMRRKSTKMFGANIVQINPGRGSRMSLIEAVAHEPPSKRHNTYRVIRGELIGKGTYGRVYLGINATTGEVLAIKQVEVNPKAAGHDKDKIKELVASLDQEIDTMQHLEHPNIVQYLGCERREYSISIFLEYISGGSIGSCLRKHGKFEEDVVRSLTRQTLEGLAYLHNAGILHRDLKADNILLDVDGTCKISDFGISKRSDNIYGNDVTNSMQGSVFWMAPEVVRSQGHGYSAKVDIWSLGCVVLEMFAGRRPWAREEAIGAIYKLGSLNQAPPIPDDVSAAISAHAVGFMLDCFQIDASERPTAETLLRGHPFCEWNPWFNFLDTELHAKIKDIM